MTNDEITIWAAGFFDGEGCISIGKPSGPKSTHYRMTVKVAQKIDTPLKVLQRYWGGSLWCDERYGSWQWQVCGENASNFLMDVLPYLIVKRKHAKLAISFQSRREIQGRHVANPVRHRKRDEADYAAMRILNKPKFSSVT